MKLKNKNILVTGGAGFIGSHLVDRLIKEEPNKIIVVDNFFLGKMDNLNDALAAFPNLKVFKEDAGNYFAMEAIIKQEAIEVVFNLATKALIYSFFNPDGAYMTNVNIARTLLNLQRNNLFKTLIHISSSEVYGSALYVPMDEQHPLNPTTPYAAGKAAADMMVMSYYNVFGLDVTIIRPFNNYGPRQNDGQLAAIIPLTAKRIMENEQPVIEGTGEQTRDLIYVGDSVRSIVSAYENEASRGKIINLGSGTELPIKDIIFGICDYFGYQGSIEYRQARTADVKRHCAGIELAKETLGFRSEVNFKSGLKKTLDWYKELYKNTLIG